MPVFKIWSSGRDKRRMVVANSVMELLTKGKIKLELNKDVHKAVCEIDGSLIDDDDVLNNLDASTIVILLMEEEEWTPKATMSSVPATPALPSLVIPAAPALQPAISSEATASTSAANVCISTVAVTPTLPPTLQPTVQSVLKRPVGLSTFPVGKFQLPKLRLSVVKALSETGTLSHSEKSSLMDHLYEEVTKYTFRPTPSIYDEVTSTLLRAYPCLKNGLQGRDAADYWKQSLSNKFRNERKRHEKDNPLAQPEKKVIKKKKEKSVVVEKAYMFGIKHYLPPFAEGEDKDTAKQHIKVMQAEDKKKRQDVGKIEHLLNLTFPDRRDKIVNQGFKIAKVKEEYPCLFNEDEMSMEFQRLTETNISDQMLTGLRKYAKPLLMVKLPGKTSQTVEESDDEMQTFSQALTILPQLLGEKLENLLNPINPNKPEQNGASARIIEDSDSSDSSSSYTVIVEKEVVCQTATFLRAVELLMVVHYAFNLVYNKKARNTLTFIQKVLLNIYDEGHTPTKVLKLLYEVNKRWKNN